MFNIKKIGLLTVILITLSTYCAACGNGNDVSSSLVENNDAESNTTAENEELTTEQAEIKSVIDAYTACLTNGDLEGSQEYLDNEYDYIKNSTYSLYYESTVEKLFSKYTFTFISAEVDDKLATAKVEIFHPDSRELIIAESNAITLGMADDAMDKALSAKLDETDLAMEETEASFALKKKQNNWEIIADSNLSTVLYLGAGGTSDTKQITENEQKQKEKQDYIDNQIELVDYLVEECEGYSGTRPGLTNVSIKNNGDKNISTLELKLDFVDDSGNILQTKDITIIGSLDSEINAGYSWKMEDDKFFDIGDLEDNVDLNKVNVSIGDVSLSEPKEKTANLTEEEQYIRDYIELNDYKVSMCKGYNGTHPGLSDISVKNNGEKDVSELTITVYFQDEQGKNIAEDSFLVIGGLFGGDTLKANYSWKMENDKFYEIKNLADEVDISRYTVEITEIEFE